MLSSSEDRIAATAIAPSTRPTETLRQSWRISEESGAFPHWVAADLVFGAELALIGLDLDDPFKLRNLGDAI